MCRLTIVAASTVLLCLSSEACAQSREWTDSTGKFKIQAEFVEVTFEGVKLRKADGTLMSVPLDRLSPADQKVVEQLRAKETGAVPGQPAVEPRSLPLQAAPQSKQSLPAAPMDSVVRIVFSTSDRDGPKEELQIIGVAVQTTEANPVIISHRASVRLVDANRIDPGLAKATIYELTSQKRLGTVATLAFKGPTSRENFRPGDGYIVLRLEDGAKIPGLAVSSKAPAKGDIVQSPRLPAALRRGVPARPSSKVEWTPCTVVEFRNAGIQFAIQPNDSGPPSEALLPVINQENQLVGLTNEFLSVLEDKRRVVLVSGNDEIFGALEKANVKLPIAEAKIAAGEFSPLPNPPDVNAPWRKSFEALLANVKVDRTDMKNPKIDWGPATEFAAWYERSRALTLASIMASDGRRGSSEQRTAQQRAAGLEKEVALAAELLKGIEWTATVKTLPAPVPELGPDLPADLKQVLELRATPQFDFPKMSYPLIFVFNFEPGERANWSKIKVGDRVRFACRFAPDLRSSPNAPVINVYMTLKEILP